MKPENANFLNSICLILMGMWAYFGSEDPSVTALIPAIGGVLLLIMSPGIRKSNKVVAHIAVLLTLLLVLALFMPLKGAIERSDNMAILRVALMMLTGIIALIAFIRSFIAARKAV